MWGLPYAVFWLSLVFFVVPFVFDIYKAFFRKVTPKINNIDEEDTEFFHRLSNLERKRWLAEETYYRSKLGI
jgi:hypothetical protein